MNWADQEYVLGRGLAAIRHIEGKDYQFFVKGVIDYNLPSLLASATGSTFPNVTRDQLANLEIFIPPPTEQKAIASVLSSLDDKIDLLHRQNKTLEAMAETLFRQWFVEEAERIGRRCA
ncbi:MAG: restriction endonuclease subunit S [Thermincola sp.]|nr:restriction endonuclease subunit S [Thermincola sp.]